MSTGGDVTGCSDTETFMKWATFLCNIEFVPQMLEAIVRIYDVTADYIFVNNLGNVHHNQSMQMLRDILSVVKGPNNG